MLKRVRDARENRDSGFTLIELLIVIIILGVLAGIVVFAVGGITDRGTLSACKSDKKTVEIAAEAYFAQNGTYAANMPALVPTFLHSVPNSPNYTITYTVAAGPPASVAVVGSVTGPPAVAC
jgi:prepilin-type N-terminal cleavage/methylation domain-containing protein